MFTLHRLNRRKCVLHIAQGHLVSLKSTFSLKYRIYNFVPKCWIAKKEKKIEQAFYLFEKQLWKDKFFQKLFKNIEKIFIIHKPR